MSDELFQQTIDLYRVAVLETKDSPPVEPAMLEKPRRTDVAELIEALIGMMEPDALRPPFLLDSEFQRDIAEGGHGEFVTERLCYFAPWRWVELRSLLSSLLHGYTSDEGWNDNRIRTIARTFLDQCTKTLPESEARSRIHSDDACRFPKRYRDYLAWALSRSLNQGMSIEDAFSYAISRKRGGPKWSVFSERVIAAEFFLEGKLARRQGKTFGHENLLPFRELEEAGDFWLLKGVSIKGWDDREPSPSIPGKTLLGHEELIQDVQALFSTLKPPMASKHLSAHNRWLKQIWEISALAANELLSPITHPMPNIPPT